MELKFAFSGGDRRMEYARDMISAAGCAIRSITDPDVTHVVLPTPAFDSAGRIAGGPPLEEILPYISEKTVLGGKLGEKRPLLATCALQVMDLLDDELLAAGNADITAEGAIGISMARLPITLKNAPVLVIGWGRIGQLLAKKLQSLGARVTVSARKKRDLGMIQALGFHSDETGIYAHGLSGYRVIYNTVPAAVISQKQAETIPARCFYLELASQPGVDPAQLQSGQFLSAGGLPGKTAPESAGILLGHTILRLARASDHQ